MRVFASKETARDSHLSDVKDLLKTDYVIEYDQGLTDEEKKQMKRFDIFRYNP